MGDEEWLAQGQHMLRADAPWQERVEGVRLLARTDPTSDAGRVATALLEDICVHDELVQAIEEAGHVLMTGGPVRVEAFLRAWDDAEGVVAGWMDNCLVRLTGVQRSDEYVAERQEHSLDPEIRRMAEEWRVFQGFPADPRAPVPVGPLPVFLVDTPEETSALPGHVAPTQGRANIDSRRR